MLTANATIQGFGNRGMRICIPAAIRSDSQFPMKIGDSVQVSIDGRKLTVTPVSAAKQEPGAMEDEHIGSERDDRYHA